MNDMQTERLLLRAFRAEDAEPFAAMNADPRVARYLPACLSRVESDELMAQLTATRARRGFGVWAVEAISVAPFVGFVGLGVPGFDAAFTPCVELAWRIGAPFWGRGFATEGARCAVRYGFEKLCLTELVAFTAVENAASRRVMEKLNMQHHPEEDFDHPRLPQGHVLSRHVLYRLRRASFTPASS